ncbi:hypothetical protein ACRYCC_07885 [Actinomadura scrupuli]|uniref:hypothetical protein n=1 Tax=Actinomadura scrupuli TaxID=559629 RepID=UPI003D964596
MTANDPVQLGDTDAASSRKANGKTEQIGHAANAVKEKAGEAGQAAKNKAGELAGKAHDAVTSEEAKPVARRSGTGAAGLAALAFAVWAWRRRSRRNAGPWEKAVRQTRTQVKATRGQAKSQAKVAKAKAKVAKAVAKQKVADAKSRAKSLR